MAWMLVRLFLRRKTLHAIQRGTPSLNLKRVARAILYLLNAHTLAMLVLAWVAVYVCDQLGWRYNMDFSMVSTGTVFPLTFTLSQAYTRRERATALIASIKASAVALYWMHRDWDQAPGTGYPNSLGNDGTTGARRAKKLVLELLLNMRKYLTSPSPYESLGELRLTASHHQYLSVFEHDLLLTEHSHMFRSKVAQLVEESGSARKWLQECYKSLSALSVLNEKLTLAAGYTRGGEGGLSRTNQYLRYLISNLEELRSLKEYRTPTMMRHACALLVHVFALVFAPYWCHYCSADDDVFCAAGYASAGVYVLITMLLLHVQQDLENCLDESGLDDAFFLTPDEVDDITGEHVLRSARSSASDMAHLMRASSPTNGRMSMELAGVALGAGGPSTAHLRTIPSGKLVSEDEEEAALDASSSPRSMHM